MSYNILEYISLLYDPLEHQPDKMDGIGRKAHGVLLTRIRRPSEAVRPRHTRLRIQAPEPPTARRGRPRAKRWRSRALRLFEPVEPVVVHLGEQQ